MDVQLIRLALDAGRWGARLGRGPGALTSAGAADRLRALGHAVEDEDVTWRDAFPTEIASSFAAAHRLRDRVRAARWRNRFPLVLSGNSLAACGVLAALPQPGTGLAWLAARSDFDTPETSTTGSLDRMALSVATGRCWRALAVRTLGTGGVDPERVLLAGARGLDPSEEEALARAGVARLGIEEFARPDAALRELGGRCDGIHLHLHLSVLDPVARPGDEPLSAAGTEDRVVRLVERLREGLPLLSASLTGYDPAHDPDGRRRSAALRLIAATVPVA